MNYPLYASSSAESYKEKITKRYIALEPDCMEVHYDADSFHGNLNFRSSTQLDFTRPIRSQP
jgi:hypothetical protein